MVPMSINKILYNINFLFLKKNENFIKKENKTPLYFAI